MKKVISLMVFSALTLITHSQSAPKRTLEYYIGYAKENSPLINDYKNQYTVSEYECQQEFPLQFWLGIRSVMLCYKYLDLQ